MLNWLKRSWESILAAGWRLVAYETFNWLFNYPLYIWAMSSLGLVPGWLFMTATSLISCAIMFWHYDHAKVDWLFANTARKWEEETTESSGWTRRMIARMYKTRKGLAGIMVFILASVHLDPMIVAVHYRQSHFNGIGSRDWGILAASVAIGNLWWGARLGFWMGFLKLSMEILKWLYKHF